VFESLSDRIEGIFHRLRGRGKLSGADVDATLREVRLALLEADVNVGVAKELLARIRERAVGSEVAESLTPAQQVIKIVHDELITTLGREPAALNRPAGWPHTILIAGLQGSGKTTSAAKLAHHLAKQGKRPLLVAADLQRPAAIDQLEQLGERIGVPVFVDRSGKPAKIAKAAKKEAGRNRNDVVIIDTAGRLHVDRDLMAELSGVAKASQPDEILLVVDAMTGQDAVNVARAFLAEVPLTGIVLAKLDGDARGGAAISARAVTGCPIKFAGLGETIEDFEVFYPERMASRILGMGDVLGLIEKAEATWDNEKAEEAARKLTEARFDLCDFLEQFQQLRRMGPINQLLGMIPGLGSQLRQAQAQISDKDLARVEAIIRSMTPAERTNPKLISGSRRRRIATGSGTNAEAVNRLLRQFEEAQKMMKMIAGGGMPAGLAGLAGPGRAAGGPAAGRRGRRR